MKKMRIAALLLAAALVASAFAGCGESKAQTGETKPQTSDNTAQEQDQQQTPESSKGTMAKIVSLDSDQLTVILADMPDGSSGDGQAPADRATPPAVDSNSGNGQTPPDGRKPSDRPAPASGSAVKSPDAPAGQPGQGGGKIQFTGEQVTYTISKDVQITKGTGGSAAEIDLSELAAGDVITFTTGTNDSGSEVIDSIQVLDRVN